MNSRDYFKDIYNDFFKVELSQKESSKEDSSLVDAQSKMTSWFDEINKLYITDESKDILKKIEEKGIEILYVTLHVGLGTFRPVKVDDVTSHKMHSEYYEISEDVANRLNIAKKEGRKIIAVGTTTTRVLETVMHKYNKFKETSEYTDIFIYPGFEFKAIDSLITNFHLPKSTLVMLVSALAGKDNILNSYKIAVEEKYRFFSFGDSMMIGDFDNDKDEV